ncbi:MAG: hypothetical protein DRJ03_30930 [Chloroflexi bacterium]|nr:MAG: hypothetical protein DRJ03_30930 [Chloroflexota bacterium]
MTTPHRGETSASLVAALIFAAVVLAVGIAVGFGLSTPADGRASTFLLQALSAPGCYIPLTFVVGVTTIAIGIGLYYSKQRLDAQARIWQARAAAEETEVARQRVELDDLTPGPDGEDVARMVNIDGKMVLVNSRLSTSPVTSIEPESAVQPNQVPDQVTMGALLASAVKQMGGGRLASRGGGSPLDGMALWMAARGMPAMDQNRVPPNVRVLDADEMGLLEEGKR